MIALLLLILIAFSSLSCVDREAKVYEVPSEVQPYVESFIVEAAERGKRLVIDDLIITYKYNIFTAKAHAAGICRKRFGHTPIIHIDTTSSNWKNSEMSREQLIYHELCHCLLDRRHKDDLLMNGNYASIMKTNGETLYGPLLNKFKREYYLSELFNPNTDPPSWAQVLETATTHFHYTDTVFIDHFGDEVLFIDSLGNAFLDSTWVDSLTYRAWPLAEDIKTRRWVREGRLELTSFDRGVFFIPFETDLNLFDNFQIEVDMALVTDAGNMAFYWGGSNTKDMYVVTISNNGFVSIGHTGLGTMAAKSGNELAQGDYNRLIIRKKDAFYFIFLNEKLIDNLSFEPINGNMMGVGVSGAPTELWVDRIAIFGADSLVSKVKF